MKICILLMVLAGFATTASAQIGHPGKAGNQSLPAKIVCSTTALQHIFSAAVNSSISVPVSNGINIKAWVLEKRAVAADQLSIHLRCTNYRRVQLNISRITEADGSYRYMGTLSGDAAQGVSVLWQQDGEYAFIQAQQLLTMVESATALQSRTGSNLK